MVGEKGLRGKARIIRTVHFIGVKVVHGVAIIHSLKALAEVEVVLVIEREI